MTALTMQVEAHEPGVLAVDLTRTDGAHSMPTVWGTIPLASLLSPVSPAPTCAAVVGEPMRVGSLFAGMGGFDLAAEWMGWSTAWYSEIDPYCQRLLAHHFPHAVALGDMTTVDWSTVAPIDVLVGGFPCQPASTAGLRKGQDDARWLWPEFVRAIRGTRPRWIVGENVRGLLSVGGGAAFGEVLRDLAELGYDAEWRVLSAADVGAPHRRERVWITAWLADSDGRRRERLGRAAAVEREGATDQPVLRAGVRGESVGHGEGLDDADGGRCEQRDADERRAAESRAGHDGVEHAARGGRGAGPGEPVRPVDGGGAGLADADRERRRSGRLAEHAGDARTSGEMVCGREAGEQGRGDAVGDAAVAGSQGHGRPVGVAVPRGWWRPTGPGSAAGVVLSPWHDAVPVRGADDTVRLIPADAAARGPESEVWPVAHGVSGRVAQLRANGNAIVPACAVRIFQAIQAVEDGRVR